MTYKGTQRLGDFFSNRREKGAVGLSTLSITLDHGIVDRDSIDRKMETNLLADEHLLGKSGDIAYNMMRMWQGASGLIERDGLLSPAYVVLAPKQEINSRYAAYLFKSPRLIYLFWAYSYGLTNDRLRLYFNDFRRIPVEIPPISEQTKIANFLTAVDEKISQLTQKYDLLKQYKKGVMQQIFSQKLRFKDDDGREFPEWETKKLGEISSSILYGMNASAITFDGENKYLRITDIDDDTRAFKPSPLSSPSGNIEAKFKMQIGDIVFARTGASVGKSYIYKPRDGNLFFAGFLIKFSISEGVPYFIFIQTLTERYRSWVKIMSMRSGQPGINAEEFKDFEISFPCKTEQTKIANFLTAIDDKITQAQTQLDAVKQYKKGLLQQLFA